MLNIIIASLTLLFVIAFVIEWVLQRYSIGKKIGTSLPKPKKYPPTPKYKEPEEQKPPEQKYTTSLRVFEDGEWHSFRFIGTDKEIEGERNKLDCLSRRNIKEYKDKFKKFRDIIELRKQLKEKK